MSSPPFYPKFPLLASAVPLPGGVLALASSRRRSSVGRSPLPAPHLISQQAQTPPPISCSSTRAPHLPSKRRANRPETFGIGTLRDALWSLTRVCSRSASYFAPAPFAFAVCCLSSNSAVHSSATRHTRPATTAESRNETVSVTIQSSGSKQATSLPRTSSLLLLHGLLRTRLLRQPLPPLGRPTRTATRPPYLPTLPASLPPRHPVLPAPATNQTRQLPPLQLHPL